ncbi:MAG: eukaryotic-like serine/threonine-protein kinase [Actinomycetota bacterium]|nr:eukaryotic-like serine/threonine-protein kinase [Actinomycetota bacterium]
MTTAEGRLVAGRYRLLDQLGKGGMGAVWRARDEVLGREVAVKEVLLPPTVSDAARDGLIERTRREARLAARLNHPNVVTVFDVVDDDHWPWLVMELVPSRSLTEIVESEGPLPPARVAAVGLQLLGALDAAHRAGVLHRDVKPGNVLITPEGRVVLGDFGIARLEGDPGLTGTGLVMGSPAYMAPERARGHPVGPASDLWSLGATLYTAVEGRAPFSRDGALPTLTAVVTDDPDPFRLAGPLAPVLSRVLDRDPTRRPGSAELRAALQPLATAPPPSTRATAAPPAPATTTPESAAPLREVQRTRAMPVPADPAPAARGAAGIGTVPPALPPRVAPPATSPGRSRRPALVIGAVALVALTALVAWAALKPDGTRGTPAARSSATADPAPSRTVRESPSAADSPSPAPSSAAPAEGSGTAPAGYTLRSDRTGFSIAVPGDWTIERDGERVYYRDPRSIRYLLIDQTDDPKEDPVADWEQQERNRSPRLPDYRRIKIEKVDYRLRAADWEFTWTDDGTPVHVLNRGFVTSEDKGYAMYLYTPAVDWAASQDELRVFQQTFVAAGD